MTLACIHSVLRQTQTYPAEIIVIDNASDDGSAEAVAEQFPQVQLIRSPENLGFARANNVAAQRASGQYILLLNTDTVVLDQAIDRLASFAFARPQAGIWGGRTVFADGTLNPTSCWRLPSIWSMFCQAVGLSTLLRHSELFNSEGYGGWLREGERKVDSIAGCFLLIRRQLWDELRGFDEQFFMYGEDADLCYRAHKAGARPLFTPEPTIVHYGGASEPARASKLEKLLAGKSTYLRKHWRRPRQDCGILLLQLYAWGRLLAYSGRAAMSGVERHKKEAGVWRQVWRARRQWARGYSQSQG